MDWLFDAHVHLSDPAYAEGMGVTLEGMARMGIRACCVSVDAPSSAGTMELAARSGLVLPFVGIHPEMAGGGGPRGAGPGGQLEEIASLVRERRGSVAGIGEIGLDPAYGGPAGGPGAARQAEVFAAQLSLAEECGKPVSIHSRGSLDAVCDALPSYSLAGKLIHWFDGGRRQLRRVTDLGCYVSFGPVMVYAQDKQALLRRADPERVLVETDGPVPFSRCFGRRPAQPAFLPSVVFCASKVLGMSYGEAASMLRANTERYLGI